MYYEKYLASNFGIAIAQNKGNTGGLVVAVLSSLIPHASGDHTHCNFHDDTSNYVYKNIPGNKPLESEQFKTSLNELMDHYIKNAHKRLPALSAKSNESFDSMVASFCPEAKDYSQSDSFIGFSKRNFCNAKKINFRFSYLIILFIVP